MYRRFRCGLRRRNSNGCAGDFHLVCALASDTDVRRAGAVAPFKFLRCACRHLARGPPCPPLSCRVCVCVLFVSLGPMLAERLRHTTLSPPGAYAWKKKEGVQWRRLPSAIAAVPGTEKAKKSNVQRRAATWGPHLPQIPQVLRHRSRAPPTTLEVAELVATAGMLGPQIRWSSPCWRAHL